MQAENIKINHNSEEPDVKKLPIMMSLIIGVFFAILNETLLNIAFTDLIRELQVTPATIQWLSTGFMLVIGILVPVSALIIQWFTTRQMFIGAMAIFTLGTIVCGLAPNFSMLLVGRLIQASGTGLLLPVLMNTVLVLYPPHKRGAAMGTIGLIIMFAPAIGPTLSGVIIAALDWRWLFFSVIPFAIFSILFAYIYLVNVTKVTKPKVDVKSILLSTLGFGGIVFAFSSAGEGEGGWQSPEVYLPLVIGVFAIILFVHRQLRLEEPILDIRVFKSRTFSLTAVLMIIMMMTLFSTIIILPLFLQGPLALSPLTAGLILLPGGLLNGLMSPITGRLFDKFGPRKLVIPGTFIIVVVMGLFSTVSQSSSIIMLTVLFTMLNIGISMIMMPSQTNGLNELNRKHYPHGTAILSTLQQVSGAIGVALFISIMSSVERSYLSEVSDPTLPSELGVAMTKGVQTSFTVGLFFSIAAFIIALFIKRTVPPKEV